MALFTWNSSYSVSVEQFDTEHQKLFALVNELNDAMRAGQGRFVLRNVLDSLIAYTNQHFTAEERAMKATRFPEYEAHAEEHSRLTAQVHDFAKQFEAGETAITIDVLYFLRDWLVNHIVTTDKKYSQHLKNYGMA
ncbi:MAG TPA: bacteriohemerythrin [Clostridia bacterium]|nr:bacteriohemerythrin [Clostridia bacterium]